MPNNNIERGQKKVEFNEHTNLGMEGSSCTDIEGKVPSRGSEMGPGTRFTNLRRPMVDPVAGLDE